MIYGIAEVGDRSVVKIGYTHTLHGRFDEKTVRNRLSAIQNGTWRQLAVIAAADGNREEELELHRRFFAYCVTREWFRNEGALSVWLEENTLDVPIALQCRKVSVQDLNNRRAPVEVRDVPTSDFCSYCSKWGHQAWRCPNVIKQERSRPRRPRVSKVVRELDEIARVSRVIRARMTKE